MLFIPFSDRRLALDWVFIVDPALTGILLAGMACGWVWPRRARVAAISALAALAAYVGLCAWNHAEAQKRVERLAAERLGAEVQAVAALPMPPHAFRWRGLIRTAAEVHEAQLNLISGEVEWLIAHPALSTSSSVLPSTPERAALERIARFPTVRIRKAAENTEYTLADRQFEAVPGRSAYQLTMTLDSHGRLSASEFSDAHVLVRVTLYVLLIALAGLCARRWMRDEAAGLPDSRLESRLRG